MSQKGVTAVIDFNGDIVVDVFGMHGKCKDIIKDVDSALQRVGERTSLKLREESKDMDNEVVAQNKQG